MAINQGPLAQASQPSPTQQSAEIGRRAAEMQQQTQPDYQALMSESMGRFREEQERLNMAVDKMIQSLDRRKNLPFDPQLMQLAAAFARPTKTGSFGESLGYAAEAAVRGAEEEFAREQAEAKMGLELQQKKAELARRQLGMETLQKFMPQVTTMTGGPGVPTGTPAGVPAGAPAPMRQIPPEFAAMQEFIDPETGKVLSSIAKSQMQEREILTKESQPVKVDMGFDIGVKEVSQKLAREYEQILNEVNRTGNEDLLLDFFARQRYIKRVPTAPGEPVKYERIKTPAERAGEEAQIKSIGELRGKQSEEKGNLLISRADQAFNTTRLANNFISYAENNPRAFELMQDPTIANRIGTALEQGVQIGQFGSINLPTRTIAGYQLKKEDLDALKLFYRDAAEITVMSRQSSRIPGEGAFTESEGRLFETLGILKDDSADVVKLKAEAMLVRAKQDEEVAEAWVEFSKDPRNTYRDFLIKDPKLKEIKAKYAKIYEDIRESNADLLRTAPKRETRSQSSKLGEKSLTERLKEARSKRGNE